MATFLLFAHLWDKRKDNYCALCHNPQRKHSYEQKLLRVVLKNAMGNAHVSTNTKYLCYGLLSMFSTALSINILSFLNWASPMSFDFDTATSSKTPKFICLGDDAERCFQINSYRKNRKWIGNTVCVSEYLKKDNSKIHSLSLYLIQAFLSS